MQNVIYAKPSLRYRRMNWSSKNPLDDIKKMGDVLMPHLSEKGKLTLIIFYSA